jgi:hypothetical protein
MSAIYDPEVYGEEGITRWDITPKLLDNPVAPVGNADGAMHHQGC